MFIFCNGLFESPVIIWWHGLTCGLLVAGQQLRDLVLWQTYESLGNVFKGEKDVVIAKCDADSHKELGEK